MADILTRPSLHPSSNSTNTSLSESIPNITTDNGAAVIIHSITNLTTNQSSPNISDAQILVNGNTTGNITDPSAAFQIEWLGFPKMDNFVDVFSICCSIAVIFGGLIPYIPQYLKIKRSKNSDGFSTYGMMAMMEICIRVRDKRSTYTISAIGLGSATTNGRRQFRIDDSTGISISSFHSYQEPSVRVVGEQQESVTKLAGGFTGSGRDFWDWDDLSSYIKFLSLFTLFIATLTYLLLHSYIYIEILGYVAVFTEAMLGMPQLLKNYSKKSTQGMSVEMVIMWLSGDLFKTLYFIIRRAPAQFSVCGSIQVIVDILILYQVLWYKRPKDSDKPEEAREGFWIELQSRSI